MSYNYERTAASATPVLDKVYRNYSAVERKLIQAIVRTDKQATALEDLIKKGQYGSDAAGKAMQACLDAAYPAVDALRELKTKGKAEVDAMKGLDIGVVKQARNLMNSVDDMFQSYDALAQAIQDRSRGKGSSDAAKKAAHDLSMAVGFTKSILVQYADAYGT